MSCYSSITGDESVYFYYDTSGSIAPDDLANLRLAVDDVIVALVAAGISAPNISEVNSTNERYLPWFNQTPSNYLVVAFINEAAPSYHSTTSDTGPTSAWTSDYNTFKSHVSSRTFRGLLYALDTSIVDELGTADAVETFNSQHAPHAVSGSDGYPSGADSLQGLGVRLHAHVPIDRNAAAYARDILDFLTGWVGGGFCERIRSSISEDAGSLFQATQAVAVELGVGEAYSHGIALRGGSLHPFREAIVPEQVAVRYFPVPTRNQEMLSTIEGETKLGRMASVYPAAIMGRIADITAFSGATSATAQEAISYIFSRWATQFTWFTYEAVPDLRLLVSGAVGAERQHYIDRPSAGVVSIEAIAIPQDGTDRKSMREIVDEWIGIFPGTVLRQNSSGNIELVPRVGPDSPSGAAVELTWRDIISMSDGEDDPRGVVNIARVEVRGYEWNDEQAPAPPAFLYYAASGGLAQSVVAAEGDIPDTSRQPIEGVGYSLDFTGLVSPEAVEVTCQVIAYGSWEADDSNNYGALTITGGTATLNLLPGGSGTVSVTTQARGTSNETTFTITRLPNGNAIQVSNVSNAAVSHNNVFGATFVGYLLLLDLAGTAWVAADPVTAKFGYNNGVDFIPSVDDPAENALASSATLYGEREATINSTVFNLTPIQAQQVAQGYVLFNINPRTIRDVRQSEWNRYPVRFDTVGRLVDLPNGERAVVENRSYSDSFAPDGGMMQSSFTATVSEVIIDTTTDFLLFDDGSYFTLDDGSFVIGN